MITKPGTDAIASTHRSPWFLPDGRHFLYHLADRTVWAGSLDGGSPRKLLSCDSNAVYAEPGYLLCIRDNTLFAQPFDAVKLEIGGAPLVLSEKKVIQNVADGKGQFSVSNNGILAYQGVPQQVGHALLQWINRSGKVLASINGPGEYGHPHISPDGKLVTFSYSATQTMQRDIWVHDNDRGISTRLTSEHAYCGNALVSNDRASVIFSVYRDGQAAIYRKQLNGGPTELVLKTTGSNFVESWSPDGRYLLYTHFPRSQPNEPRETWILPLFGDRKPYRFVPSEFDQNYGSFSPDGKWVAYESGESGDEEIYVAPFPRPGENIRVSNAGGTWARWRGDGKELSYLSPDNAMMAVDVFYSGRGIHLGSRTNSFRAMHGLPVITPQFMMFRATVVDS